MKGVTTYEMSPHQNDPSIFLFFFLLEDSTSVVVHGFWIFIILEYLIGFNLTM
jgi:hypothetical protein